MIKRQHIGLLLFYCCGYSRIRNFTLRLKHKRVARFVAFHDLPQEVLKSFEDKMTFLKRDTNVVSFDDFMSGRLCSEKVNVVITFDDGFKNWITYAMPILQKLALPATFFISAGIVGLSKDDANVFIQSKLLRKQSSQQQQKTVGLTCDDVKRIADQGFTIGGHTLTHCNISALRDNVKLKYEIAEDKSRLEKITGNKINYFSYPFGNYQNTYLNVSEVLCETGFKGAVTTTPGFNNRYTNPFFLHRDPIMATTNTTVFKACVYGNHDAVQWMKKFVRNSEISNRNIGCQNKGNI